ncbi:MAG TPA: ribosome maturation factor RimM [Candidatus Xenobia bacterium]|nr:ribosome maturation factor RimM [Candidatus Xenobia bacterium]
MGGEPAREPERLTVARIVKTQGRRGEVAAQILTDFPDRLQQRTEVWLWDGSSEPRRIGIERIWPHKHFLVFQFTGIESISQAEELVGLEIQIPSAEAAKLEAGTFFEYELSGCCVVDQATGAKMGYVRELVQTDGTPLLTVDTPDGKELLIPFAQEICRRIVPAERRIEVVLPEGLKELN